MVPTNYGLTRMVQPSRWTRGWWVQLCHQGRKTQRLFSDRLHGGEQNALAAAIAWRDAQLSAMAGKVIYLRTTAA
jgi:hypothetical protein